MNLTGRTLLFGVIAALVTCWPSDARLSTGRSSHSTGDRPAAALSELRPALADTEKAALPGERELDDRFGRLRREILMFKSDVYHDGLEGEFGGEVAEMMATVYKIDAVVDEMRTTSGDESLETRRNVVVSIEMLERRLSDAIGRSRASPSEPRFVTELRRLWL